MGFRFENVSKFDVKLSTTCRSKKCGGRNFLFAGSSSLAHTCKEAVRPGLCAAFGDPHFVTFDGAHTVLMRHQSLWLVRSRDVWIQAESIGSDGRLQAVAIGGPFIKNHTLLLRKLNTTTLQATLDGKVILDAAEADYSMPDVVEAHRRTKWNATLHNDDALAVRTQIQFNVGPWPERFLERPVGGLFLLKFPGGVEVTATGVDFMTVVVTMPPASGGQSGYCGNFNSDKADDYTEVRPSFHQPIGADLGPINPSESLLGSAGLQSQSAVGTQVADPDTVLSECSASLMTMAVEVCKGVSNLENQRDCIFDVCETNLVSAADGALAAELLETKVNTRGIPLPVGTGRCHDAVQRLYVSISTNLHSAEDCKDVLRSLALTDGVMGAQLKAGGTCEVLIERGANPQAVAIQGGWGPTINEEANGQGIICGVTVADSDWSCWQLV